MKNLKRLLLSAGALAFVGRRRARRHELVLRRRRRHGLRPLPRDPADGRGLVALEPPRREVQGLPRQLLLRRAAHAREEPAARVAALARRDAGADPHPPPGRRGARRALRLVPPPGVRRLAERPPRRAVRGDLHQPRAQREPAADGRLPALPRAALRGRHPRPRHAARPQGPVDVRERGRRRAAGGAVPHVPLRPPPGRAVRAAQRARVGRRPAPRRSSGRRSRSTTGAPSSTSASTVCRCRRWWTRAGR